MGPRTFRSFFVNPGKTYAIISYRTTGAANKMPVYPATFTVVKKYSPGPSCRNRTPISLTGFSRNMTKSFAKQKQSKIPAATAPDEMSALSRSSSKCSQIDISTSSGSSSSPGYRNDRTVSFCACSSGMDKATDDNGDCDCDRD